MSARDAWWNRPMIVTHSTLCESCGQLKPDVEKRDIGIWSRVWFTSCRACAEREQRSLLGMEG